MSDSIRIEELRKEIESLCGNCDRPNKEQLGEIILSSMALGFSVGLKAPSADWPQNPHTVTYINALENRIKELEADRPQGEWIVSDDKYFHTCQFCNAEVDVSMGTGIFVNNDEVSHMNFCPNCGAHMKGVDNE